MFCKIEISDGNLSISGVIGPTKNGNAYGGAGQIDMKFSHRDPADNDERTQHPITPEELLFAKGWNVEMWYTLLEVWHDWHLNNMHAGCVHQDAAWTPKKVYLYHYVLTPEAQALKQSAKNAAIDALVNGKVFAPTPMQSLYASLPYEIVSPWTTIPEHYKPREKSARLPSVETKYTNWLRESEHPDGILCKPCPVCGYRYGTAWNKVALPESVVDFLNSLPDTDKSPHWV